MAPCLSDAGGDRAARGRRRRLRARGSVDAVPRRRRVALQHPPRAHVRPLGRRARDRLAHPRPPLHNKTTAWRFFLHFSSGFIFVQKGFDARARDPESAGRRHRRWHGLDRVRRQLGRRRRARAARGPPKQRLSFFIIGISTRRFKSSGGKRSIESVSNISMQAATYGLVAGEGCAGGDDPGDPDCVSTELAAAMRSARRADRGGQCDRIPDRLFCCG